MTVSVAAPATEFSVRPWTTVDLGDVDAAADALDELLDALRADNRALGAVVGYEPDTHRLYALFQVELDARDRQRHRNAAALAQEIFDAALAAAQLELAMTGLVLAEGGPDDLP